MRFVTHAPAVISFALGSLFVLLGLATAGRSHGASSATGAAVEMLNAEVEIGRTPSVQYRFFSADSILFVHVQGLADVDRKRLATRRTTYNVFSITKTVTALAILQLMENGLLTLDTPLAELLPDFPYGDGITVRHLLAHSSGIEDPIPLRWTHLERDHDGFDRDRFFGAIFQRRPDVKHGPNDRFRYSNLGYVLLGQIIEAVSGLSYEEYVTGHVLESIGLSQAELGFTMDSATHARGYHRRGTLSYVGLRFLIDREAYMDPPSGRWRAFRPYYVNGAAYGGLVGTADGLARYGQALLGPHNVALTEDSRSALMAENILADGTGSGMALAWFRGALDGHAYLAHAGGGGGYYAELRLYPDLRVGSVILFNRTGMSDARYLDDVDRHLIAGMAP